MQSVTQLHMFSTQKNLFGKTFEQHIDEESVKVRLYCFFVFLQVRWQLLSRFWF